MTAPAPVDMPAHGDIIALVHFSNHSEWRVSNDLPQHLHLVSTVTGQRRAMTKRAYRRAVGEGRAWIVSRGTQQPAYAPQGRPPAS